MFDDNFFQNRINRSFIFGLWPKVFLTFHNHLSAGLPKQRFALLDEYFMVRKSFLNEYTFFKVLWFGWTIFQNVCEKFWAKLSKLLSTCRGRSVDQFFFKKFLYLKFCLNFSGNSFEFSRRFGSQNCNLTVQMKIILTFFPLKNKFLYMLQDFNQKVIDASASFLGMVVKIAI